MLHYSPDCPYYSFDSSHADYPHSPHHHTRTQYLGSRSHFNHYSVQNSARDSQGLQEHEQILIFLEGERFRRGNEMQLDLLCHSVSPDTLQDVLRVRKGFRTSHHIQQKQRRLLHKIPTSNQQTNKNYHTEAIISPRLNKQQDPKDSKFRDAPPTKRVNRIEEVQQNCKASLVANKMPQPKSKLGVMSSIILTQSPVYTDRSNSEKQRQKLRIIEEKTRSLKVMEEQERKTANQLKRMIQTFRNDCPSPRQMIRKTAEVGIVTSQSRLKSPKQFILKLTDQPVISWTVAGLVGKTEHEISTMKTETECSTQLIESDQLVVELKRELLHAYQEKEALVSQREEAMNLYQRATAGREQLQNELSAVLQKFQVVLQQKHTVEAERDQLIAKNSALKQGQSTLQQKLKEQQIQHLQYRTQKTTQILYAEEEAARLAAKVQQMESAINGIENSLIKTLQEERNLRSSVESELNAQSINFEVLGSKLQALKSEVCTSQAVWEEQQQVGYSLESVASLEQVQCGLNEVSLTYSKETIDSSVTPSSAAECLVLRQKLRKKEIEVEKLLNKCDVIRLCAINSETDREVQLQRNRRLSQTIEDLRQEIVTLQCKYQQATKQLQTARAQVKNADQQAMNAKEECEKYKQQQYYLRERIRKFQETQQMSSDANLGSYTAISNAFHKLKSQTQEYTLNIHKVKAQSQQFNQWQQVDQDLEHRGEGSGDSLPIVRALENILQNLNSVYHEMDSGRKTQKASLQNDIQKLGELVRKSMRNINGVKKEQQYLSPDDLPKSNHKLTSFCSPSEVFECKSDDRMAFRTRVDDYLSAYFDIESNKLGYLVYEFLCSLYYLPDAEQILNAVEKTNFLNALQEYDQSLAGRLRLLETAVSEYLTRVTNLNLRNPDSQDDCQNDDDPPLGRRDSNSIDENFGNNLRFSSLGLSSQINNRVSTRALEQSSPNIVVKRSLDFSEREIVEEQPLSACISRTGQKTLLERSSSFRKMIRPESKDSSGCSFQKRIQTEIEQK